TFNFINVDADIINAKQNAAAFFYEQGSKLLTSKNRFDARKAYSEFNKAKSLISNFRDVDVQIRTALDLGTSYVLLKMNNRSGIPLPQDFENELTRLTSSDLNRQWIHFFSNDPGNVPFDYSVNVNVLNIDVSPEKVFEEKYSESKKVEDGWE